MVVGGSIAGLATAYALSTAGRPVRVLERAAPPPEWPAGEPAAPHRPSVPQAEHSHTMTSLGLRLLRDHLPDVLDRVMGRGARLLDLTLALPRTASDREPRPGDEELVALGCRRATFERALYEVVAARPGVSVEHGVTVRGLLADAGRVTGVVDGSGTHHEAAYVVDATGRRGASAGWLAGLGRAVADDLSAPSGLRGHTRFYRLRDPAGRPGFLNRGNAAGGIWSHHAAVLHPADAGVFSVALGALPRDPGLGDLRRPGAFDAVARATPGLAPWLDDAVAQPISPVTAITCPPNVVRGAAREPAIDGLFPVGDAACITDPLFGRGMAQAMMHAFRLPGVVEKGADAAADLVGTILRPWYEFSARSDRDRILAWGAAVEGRTPPVVPDRPGRLTTAMLGAAAQTDGMVWRAQTRLLMSLAEPDDVLTDPEIAGRVARAGA